MVRRAFVTTTFFLFIAFPAWAQEQLVDRVVAVVNDDAITQSELDIFLRPLYEELKKQYEGRELERQLYEVRLKLLNQIIEDRLVFQEAKARGIVVDESEINRMIEESKSRFASEAEFESLIESQGYNMTKLRENYQRQIAIRRLHDIEIRSQVVVSPQEIEDYYKNRQSEFAEEESLKVYSLTIKKSEEAASKGLVDETAKSKIESLHRRILQGKDFKKLAQEFSEDANSQQGGEVGWVKRGVMLPHIDEVLFGLQPGGISPVLETSLGYHLFKVEETKASRVPPLAEVREKIRMILFQEEARARFKEWMDELKNRAYISIR